ncbi:MAG TPA: biosynthetic arginine decarboxylase, partial [Candidatus Tenderia electrophaga]|nr:biosynthetic arginine decarboxylase [Candidatus Tenderia electrophaga]
MMSWNLEQARRSYNVRHWGGGYFDINQQGHLVVYPDQNKSRPGIDVYELSQRLAEQKLSLPVLLRFTDILRDRVTTLCDAFDLAMLADGYQGGYTAVYPIKVNQQRTVVEHICQNGADRIGLEAGSKPELMAVLGMSRQGGVIVCNGYKDREYIRLALIGQQLGFKVFIVIEKPSELQLVLQESDNLGIEPMLGLRVRLASIGAGKWQNTGGEKSKFGLTSSQVLAVVNRLSQAGKLDTLQLLHCHLGSQIANIRDIQSGMREMGRYYAELCALGAALTYVDVGGGLGVDYEGTRSRSYCSMNYSVQEYANNVVHALKVVCEEKSLPQPMIISESGRALTAHHAMLITNVIDSDIIEIPTDIDALETPDDPKVMHYLWNVMSQADIGSPLEAYHDAVHWLQQAQDMYAQGVMTLEQRARAEQLYYLVSAKVKTRLNPSIRAQRELLDELNEKQADKYFCNFSLFQSLPDVWAIDQVFPIMPLHRLDEEPTRRVVIQDLT